MLLNSKKEHEINTYPLVWKDLFFFFFKKSMVSYVNCSNVLQKAGDLQNKIIYDRKTKCTQNYLCGEISFFSSLNKITTVTDT